MLTAAGCLACPGEPQSPTAEKPRDYQAHVRALRARLPHADFHIVVEPPFVVIGDEPAEVVARRSRQTVRWAVEKLKALYFEKDPEPILDVWLFKDEASYRTHARQLFGETPSTPFGYYSSRHRALVMNISTGGGTLVHEIVHPYVQANFPGCPSWFNEGLGSLYEQSAERDGRIVGLVNWRLPGLQRAIREGKLPSFEKLTAMTQDGFYSDDRGTNYGQARYLCYWLQEHGLLQTYWRRFRADHATDPSGYRSLRKILGRDDMAAFQREWEAWVLELQRD